MDGKNHCTDKYEYISPVQAERLIDTKQVPVSYTHLMSYAEQMVRIPVSAAVIKDPFPRIDI